MPAYFWLHNLYALERNSWKARDRDQRMIKIQHIETDYLAPDTVEEIIVALGLLEGWLGEAGFSPGDMTGDMAGVDETPDMRLIPCRNMEKGKRHQMIIKPLEAVAAYRQMLHWYAAKTIAAFFDARPDLDYRRLCNLLAENGAPSRSWVNIGGQIAPSFRVDQLRQEIGAGKYCNWDEIHQVYKLWHDEYPLDKARHAWAVLTLLGVGDGTSFLKQELAASIETRRWISDQIYQNRLKDYRDPFRKATFRNNAEMEQVLGKLNENPFIRLSREEDRRYEELIAKVMSRL
jgi:hypothetical protein